MKKFLLLTLTILSVSFLGSAQTKKPATTKKPEPKHTTVSKPKDTKPKGQRVEISTDFGVLIIRLYDETPLHRDNFIKLVKQGFYDSLMFHRVIKSFMIQGGDPTSKHADSNAMLGAGDIGYKIPAEFNPSLYHKRGALAAARDNNPQQMSSGCQFYIVQGKVFTTEELTAAESRMAIKMTDKQKELYTTVGGAPWLDGAYTVFGELVEGFDVLDSIGNTATGPNDRPATDIRMTLKIID
jgi:peptidyl-prolyl cis-trans isomerase B (cyclophilin B)